MDNIISFIFLVIMVIIFYKISKSFDNKVPKMLMILFIIGSFFISVWFSSVITGVIINQNHRGLFCVKPVGNPDIYGYSNALSSYNVCNNNKK